MKTSSSEVKSVRQTVFTYMRGRPMNPRPITTMSREDFIDLVIYLKSIGSTEYDVLDERNQICSLHLDGNEIGRAYYRIKLFHVYEDFLSQHYEDFLKWRHIR